MQPIVKKIITTHLSILAAVILPTTVALAAKPNMQMTQIQSQLDTVTTTVKSVEEAAGIAADAAVEAAEAASKVAQQVIDSSADDEKIESHTDPSCRTDEQVNRPKSPYASVYLTCTTGTDDEGKPIVNWTLTFKGNDELYGLDRLYGFHASVRGTILKASYTNDVGIEVKQSGEYWFIDAAVTDGTEQTIKFTSFNPEDDATFAIEGHLLRGPGSYELSPVGIKLGSYWDNVLHNTFITGPCVGVPDNQCKY